MIITAGKYKGRKLFVPNEKITRPTLSKVRMGVFNTLYSIIGDFSEKTFLDLFGGSGVMGLEALSRYFEYVTVCEKNLSSANIIKKNYALLNLKPNLFIGDSLNFLKNNEKHFDVIYVDPPYESDIYEQVFSLISTDSILVAEHFKELNIKNFELIKSKNYGGKNVSFFSKK